jgi:hypothetical protein
MLAHAAMASYMVPIEPGQVYTFTEFTSWNDFFQESPGPNNLNPTTEWSAQSGNQGGNVSVTANPGFAGAVLADFAMQFDWDLLGRTWSEVANWTAIWTFDADYDLQIFYSGPGSGSADSEIRVVTFGPQPWYDIIVPVQLGSGLQQSQGTINDTFTSSVANLPGQVGFRIRTRAGSVPGQNAVNTGYAALDLNSISLEFVPVASQVLEPSSLMLLVPGLAVLSMFWRRNGFNARKLK